MAGIGGEQARYILINFPDATSVHHLAGDTIEGTIYAPLASFLDNNSSNVQGYIVVREYIMTFPFGTTLFCVTAPPSASPSTSPALRQHLAQRVGVSQRVGSPSASPSPSASGSATASPPSPSAIATPSIPVPSPSAPIPIPVTGNPIGRITLLGLTMLVAGLAVIGVTTRCNRTFCPGTALDGSVDFHVGSTGLLPEGEVVTSDAPEILDRLLWQDAQHRLARHTPLDGLGTDDDSRAWCGRAWPCSPRRLAERAAAVASPRTWRRAWSARHDLNSLRSLPSLRVDLGPSVRTGVGADRAENSRSTGGLLGLAFDGLEQPAARRSGTNRGRFD